MSDYRTPPIIPNNELTRSLEAIRQINAGGGSRSTVLPPPPPLTPEETEALQRYSRGLGDPPGTHPQDVPMPDPPDLSRDLAPPSPPSGPVTGFLAIDLRNMLIMADNGMVFGYHPNSHPSLVSFCMNVMESALFNQVEELRKHLGMPRPEKPPVENKDVPQVPKAKGPTKVRAKQGV